MNFVAVPVFYYLDGDAIGKLDCFGVRPSADILFAAYANFRIVGAAHRNISAGGAHGDARIGRNSFGRDFQVVVVRISAEITEVQMASGKFAFYGIDADHDAYEKK